MSNPYKRAEQVKRVPPGSRTSGEQETPPVETTEQPVKAEKENTIVEPEVKKNLLSGMIEQKPKAKSYGFYLDDEVVAALEKLAKQNKSNKSKVLNTLLRNLLLEDI